MEGGGYHPEYSLKLDLSRELIYSTFVLLIPPKKKKKK
jgi:hypothetical protein